MSLVPVDPGDERCWYTKRSHEPGYMWRCKRPDGHKGPHVLRRYQARSSS